MCFVNSTYRHTNVLHIDESHAGMIVSVWTDERESYMNNLRERTFGLPLVLDCVHTRMGVTMATDSMSKRTDIHTILSLGLKHSSDTQQHATSADSSYRPNICVELSTDNAQIIYEKLEQIQAQLDALSEKPQ